MCLRPRRGLVDTLRIRVPSRLLGRIAANRSAADRWDSPRWVHPPYLNCEGPVPAGPLLADPAGQLVPVAGDLFLPCVKKGSPPPARMSFVPGQNLIPTGHALSDPVLGPSEPPVFRPNPVPSQSFPPRPAVSDGRAAVFRFKS